MISLVASLANLDKLPTEAREAMQGLGATVRATLVTALSKALIVAEKMVKSRWPKKSNGEAQTTGYAGQASDIKRWSVPTGAKAETHTLHATAGNDNPTGTSGQSANANNNSNVPATGTVIYRGAKEVTLDKQLHEWNEQTKDSELKKKIQAAVSHLREKLNPLLTAIAKAFKNFNTKLEALKKIRDNKDSKPQQITTAEGESASALASLANAQQAAEPALQQQATLVQACEADAAGCFAAGTKLWTPQGYQNVEDLHEGDLVYSRNEHRPDGLIEAKPIEKAFRRLAEIVHLHLRGPNGNLVTIRTTGEHPFYAFDKGWMPTKELTSDDWVLTEAGDWAKVEETFATGDMEVVYNLRVAEWHTYFVRDEGWGWSAWAHNAYSVLTSEVRGDEYVITKGNNHEMLANNNFSIKYFPRKQDAYEFLRVMKNNLAGENFTPPAPWLRLASAERIAPGGHVGSSKMKLYFQTTLSNITYEMVQEWYNHLDYVVENSKCIKSHSGDDETTAFLAKHIGSRDSRWWVVHFYTDSGILATAYPPNSDQLHALLTGESGE